MPMLPPANGRTFTAYLLLAAAIVLIDQLTKGAAQAYLAIRPPLDLAPFLSLVLVHNEGAAFGFLGDAGGWQRHLFSALAVFVSAALVAWLWRTHRDDAMLSFGLAFVLGGALGNLIDRVTLHYVVDFVLLHYGPWHFPVFNFADTAITFGAAALLLDTLGWRRGGRVS